MKYLTNVRDWSQRRKDNQYYELSNLNHRGSTLSERYPERPWWKEFSLETWRPVVWSGVTVSSLVLIANVAVLISGLKSPSDDAGTRKLYEGSCNQSNASYTAWHLLINILSTFLLGASNAASQILAAPTREEVDKAHAKGTYLHIGVFDFLNLRWITWKRIILCGLIALSSIPLHLLYNSAIFNTTAVYDYYAFMVTPDFVTGGNYSVIDTVRNIGGLNNFPGSSYTTSSSDVSVNPAIDNDVASIQQEAVNGSLKTLSWQDCAQRFAVDLMASYSAVLLVTADNPNKTNAFWSSYKYYTPSEMSGQDPRLSPYAWMCNGTFPCSSGNITRQGQWTLARSQNYIGEESNGATETVNHCLVKEVPQKCSLDLSIHLMITVIVCNCIKLTCFLMCLSIKEHKPLITVGDAVCSFLARPDPYTVGLGPVSSREVRRGHYEIYRQAVSMAREQLPNQELVYPGRPWDSTRHKYYSAVGLGRWISTGILSMIIFITGLTLLIVGLSQNGYGSNSFNKNLGLNPQDVLSGGFSLFNAVFIANILQLAVSNAYLLINGIFTCALLAQELADFGKTAKTMRVTRPRGAQRSTYWLQLPYRWSLPLMAIMVLLHWLISEALFMVDVHVLDFAGNESAPTSFTSSGTKPSFYGLAWGPTATLCAVIEGGLLIVFLYVYGFLKFPSGVPVLSSCSIAISAACHPSSEERKDAIMRPLRYGVLRTDKLGDAQPVGFTAMDDVAPLQAGEVYGGAPFNDEADPFADGDGDVRPASPSVTVSASANGKVPSENIEVRPLDSPTSRARSRPGWRRKSSAYIG